MLFNRNSDLLKKINSLLIVLSCVGLLMTAFVLNGFAQSLENGTDNFLGMTETPGFVDDGFRPLLSGVAATVNRTLVQPDGKILVAGNFNLINAEIKNGIARFNADGSLDLSFNAKSGANGSINAIGLQSDGKIVMGGVFTNYAGQTVGNIARLNADGSFDLTFNASGVYNSVGANNAVSDMTVLPDNKIVIGGSFTNYNGTAVNRLARLNPGGSIDPTFVVGTGPDSAVSVIEQHPGGKVLIGGSFANYNGAASARLARLNSDGSLDSTFAIGTGVTGSVRSFAVLPDGKIMFGGNITAYNGVTKNGVVRVNSDGSNDATFSVTGTGASINAIVRQSDGKFVVGGVFPAIGGQTRQSIARLTADGGFDATFDAGTGLNPTGSPAAGSINDMALQADGTVVFVGSFTSYNGATRSSIARASTNGTLDASLNPTSVRAGNINAIARQADGKVLIGGTFTAVGSAARGNIARLNANGSLDATFDGGSGANNFISAIGVQADGKVLISGNFTNYNGTTINRIARLNADGSLDTGFNPGTGIPGEIYSFAFQTDGKILIGGAFPTYNAVTVNNIARLNTDGSLDSSFATGTGLNGTVRKVIVQPDGKIIAAGEFATFNGSPKTRLARINANGSDDASFVTGTINSAVRDVALQADGKLVIVGSFTSVNAVTRNRAARLNANGSLDTTFDSGAGFTGGDPLAIAALPDGKYMVGGAFTTVNGLPRNRIARLRANGTLDPKFLQGLGPIGSTAPQIRTIVPHNGKYLVGGQFETYNTSARSGVLLMSNATKAPVDFNGDGKTDWAIARHYGGIGRWTWWINYNGTDKVYGFDYGIFAVDGLQPGDFDGDGKTDVAVRRGASGPAGPIGYWIVFSTTNSMKFIPFGLSGDRSVLEDYDGDGKDDLAVYRAPETTVGPGTWYYQTSFNNPNNNVYASPFGMRYGDQADQTDDIYPGDFDGDGKADFRVQRRLDTSVATSSTAAIFYTFSTSTGQVSHDYFGWASDRTIPGDYDGDGKTDLAIARGFNFTPGTTTWYIRYTSGIPDATIQWGAGGLDQFAQGDYDGDGTTDITVYRRANENIFYVRRSSDLMLQAHYWGTADPLGGPASDVAIASYNNR